MAKRTRNDYNDAERKEIVAFIVQNECFDGLHRDEIWIDMAKLMPRHTWQSLKNHFRRTVLPSISTHKLAPAIVDRIRNGMKASNTNPYVKHSNVKRYLSTSDVEEQVLDESSNSDFEETKDHNSKGKEICWEWYEDNIEDAAIIIKPTKPKELTECKPAKERKWNKYTEAERGKIIAYIRENNGFDGLHHSEIWKDMEKLLPNHSWMSLKNHFFRAIVPSLSNYNLPLPIIQKFRAVIPSVTVETQEPYLKVSARSRKRREYNEDERNQIIAYIVKHNCFDKLTGTKMWQDMEKKIPSHTWQSLKNHFYRTVMPSISMYKLSPDIIQRFRDAIPCQSHTYRNEPDLSGSDKEEKEINESSSSSSSDNSEDRIRKKKDLVRKAIEREWSDEDDSDADNEDNISCSSSGDSSMNSDRVQSIRENASSSEDSSCESDVIKGRRNKRRQQILSEDQEVGEEEEVEEEVPQTNSSHINMNEIATNISEPEAGEVEFNQVHDKTFDSLDPPSPRCGAVAYRVPVSDDEDDEYSNRELLGCSELSTWQTAVKKSTGLQNECKPHALSNSGCLNLSHRPVPASICSENISSKVINFNHIPNSFSHVLRPDSPKLQKVANNKIQQTEGHKVPSPIRKKKITKDCGVQSYQRCPTVDVSTQTDFVIIETVSSPAVDKTKSGLESERNVSLYSSIEKENSQSGTGIALQRKSLRNRESKTDHVMTSPSKTTLISPHSERIVDSQLDVAVIPQRRSPRKREIETGSVVTSLGKRKGPASTLESDGQPGDLFVSNSMNFEEDSVTTPKRKDTSETNSITLPILPFSEATVNLVSYNEMTPPKKSPRIALSPATSVHTEQSGRRNPIKKISTSKDKSPKQSDVRTRSKVNQEKVQTRSKIKHVSS